MTTTSHIPESSIEPAFEPEIIQERLRAMATWLQSICVFAHTLDWLGEAEQYPEGSAHRKLAGVRDRADLAVADFLRQAACLEGIRAKTTHCFDLLLSAAFTRMGDGPEALQLMRRYHELFGDESKPDGSVTVPETFPDLFALDTYLRVAALAELVEQFPNHLQHGAREMRGWPMIVTHDHGERQEFDRIATRLEVGADYQPGENDR